MSTFEFLYDIDDKIFDYVMTNLTETYVDKLGLDPRAGGFVWVDEDTIVVRKGSDGSLQYYGGFEYVNKEYRREMGDYVFYFGDDSRVRRHLDIYYDIERPEEEDEED
jgi:hypothetical protein